VNRTTFVIDPTGRVAQVFEKVKPEEHGQAVADAVAALNLPSGARKRSGH
jgi:peroxiredoxin